MVASLNDSENNFYEALGLTSGASAQEIRDAFILYVRLLHPDQQIDPDLKHAAEIQMRKLNRIYDVLSDPEQRRLYDLTLLTGTPTTVVFNPPSDVLERLKPKLIWLGAIALSAGLLIWLASDSQPAYQLKGTDSAGQFSSGAAPFSTAQPDIQSSPRRVIEKTISDTELADLKAKLASAIDQRDAALREVNRLKNAAPQTTIQYQQPPAPEPKTLVASVDPVVPPPRPPSVAAAVQRAQNSILDTPRTERPAAAANTRQLAGSWFYIRPTSGQSNKNRALYPPEYIEATIVEEAGVLHGKLRAKFEIVDRAISPDVNFTFTGSQNGLQASGPWIGAGGSKGEVSVKLTSENALRIDWTATDLGTQMGLSSGTAVLTRRIE